MGSLCPDPGRREARRSGAGGPSWAQAWHPFTLPVLWGCSQSRLAVPSHRQESRWHRFRSGLNAASQPSLASPLSTSLLRNKYLYLAPAFSQGLEAPAVKIHAESPIPSVPSLSKVSPAPRPCPRAGAREAPVEAGSSWAPIQWWLFIKPRRWVAGEQVTGGINHLHSKPPTLARSAGTQAWADGCFPHGAGGCSCSCPPSLARVPHPF